MLNSRDTTLHDIRDQRMTFMIQGTFLPVPAARCGVDFYGQWVLLLALHSIEDCMDLRHNGQRISVERVSLDHNDNKNGLKWSTGRPQLLDLVI
jgi:hypothetical protein